MQESFECAELIPWYRCEPLELASESLARYESQEEIVSAVSKRRFDVGDFTRRRRVRPMFLKVTYIRCREDTRKVCAVC